MIQTFRFSSHYSFDFKSIVANIDKIKVNALNRRAPVDLDLICSLYKQLVTKKFELDLIKKDRNSLAKQKNVSQRNTELGKLMKEQVRLKSLDISKVEDSMFNEAKHIPNTTDEFVPIGDEKCAVVIFETEKPIFDFKPRSHLELCELHNMLDIDRAGKVSGTGSYYLKNSAVLLEMALVRYAMDVCIGKGFEPIITPDIIKTEVLEKCGFSPRSTDPQTYYLETNLEQKREFILAATAEFPLAVLIDLP